MGGSRWKNLLSPAKYVEQIEKSSDASFQKEEITLEQAELEFLFLGLRTTDGICLKEYKSKFGKDEGSVAIENLKAEGLIFTEKERLRLSEKGFLFSDLVFSELSG